MNLRTEHELVDEVQPPGGFKTKKQAVRAALQEYVDRRKQLEILNHLGTIDCDPTYDYKKALRLDRNFPSAE